MARFYAQLHRLDPTVMAAAGAAPVQPWLGPDAILDGAREWLFGGTVAESPGAAADLPLATYGVAAVLLLGISLAILALRYRRVPT